ncbi:MAG TPA: oxidative damage protection protein [Bdellovibrionota bacterium]|nr:oxidative damage protection protein [Bdellovibrionota bacterium]
MAELKCARCSRAAEGLTAPPIGGAMGERIQKNICGDCWKEWMTLSTKVINEYRLQLFRPDHRKILEEQMKAFFNFTD